MLETDNNISRIQCLAIYTYYKIKSIHECKRLTINLKMSTYKTYNASIFMYNFKLKALSKSLSNKVDVFQQSFRNISCTYKESKATQYKRIKLKPCSKTIKCQILRWSRRLGLPMCISTEKTILGNYGESNVRRKHVITMVEAM